jgi:hypothetical protein
VSDLQDTLTEIWLSSGACKGGVSLAYGVCVDLIGPYSVTAYDGRERVLNALTMADPSTGRFEIVEVSDKTTKTVALLFDCKWLCHYPRPVAVTILSSWRYIG